MESNIGINNASEPLHILLIGNNPIDMGRTLEKVNQIRGRKIITEIAFDLKSILERLMRFNPNFILIDDNIGKEELHQTVNALSKSKKTKNVPITVLKNSNYRESTSSLDVWDFMLKQNFTADSLYSAIRNALKLRRTQAILYKAYKRRRQVKKMFFNQI